MRKSAIICTSLDAEKVVISAAWLHDVLDHKMISDPDEYSRKEKLMREFLVARFSEEQVNLIFDIISNVSYSKEVGYYPPVATFFSYYLKNSSLSHFYDAFEVLTFLFVHCVLLFKALVFKKLLLLFSYISKTSFYTSNDQSLFKIRFYVSEI